MTRKPKNRKTNLRHPLGSEASRFPDLETKIELLPISHIKAFERNARTHDDRQIRQLAAAIRTFGFINPVVVDQHSVLIAGHGRLAAARLLGLTQVPCIRVEHLDPQSVRALRIADNRLAQLAGWDDGLLALELGELAKLELDFDIEVTGFSTSEIDVLIDGEAEDASSDPDDAVPEPKPTTVTQAGDVWLLGRHRLLCGNALQATNWDRLVGPDKASMVFTDAPYNLCVPGFVGGLGKAKHGDFAMASGEMTREEFQTFLKNAFVNLTTRCRDGALVYACMDWRHVEEIAAAARAAQLTSVNLAVWHKTNAGMGSFYRSQHELIFVFKVGTGPFRNNIELGRNGRYRTNVWSAYPGANAFRAGRQDDLADHPTVKPVGLVADAIRDCTQRGDLILDAFVGSGTTILAAERTGRTAAGMELDPAYCDVALRRWEARTGVSAVHVESGHTFSEMAARQRDATTTSTPQGNAGAAPFSPFPNIRHRKRPTSLLTA